VDDVDVNSDIEMDETPADITPLPSAAQPHVRRILETLTGREAEPAPLPDEAGNDTLQGIVSLLRGTVERGEGNSALVTGPRGAGKTRVSLNNHN
jgi:origin recognition complex subunit 4